MDTTETARVHQGKTLKVAGSKKHTMEIDNLILD